MASKDFRTLVAAARAGSEEAAAQLFVEYGNPVQRALGACSTVRRGSGSNTTAPTVAQFAWDVLFRRFADWGEIQTPDKLMAVLLKIGTNHIRDQYSAVSTTSTAVGDRCRWTTSGAGGGHRGGSPDDAMAMRDRLEAVLLRRPPEHRQILDLRVKGHTCRGIAGIVGAAPDKCGGC